jgi:aerobic C4-dicarboxylate transport protein
VATIVVGRMTGDLDAARMRRQLDNETEEEAEEPEAVLDRTESHMPASVTR